MGVEINNGMVGLGLLFSVLGFIFDIACIYFGYKLLKWVYRRIFPSSAAPEPEPNLLYTADGKPMRRAPWNGKLYEDMDEYEHDREIAEIEYSKGYSDGRAVGRINKY